MNHTLIAKKVDVRGRVFRKICRRMAKFHGGLSASQNHGDPIMSGIDGSFDIGKIDAGSRLYNADLAPVTRDERTWNWVSISALWVSMVVCLPAFYAASALISEGLSAKQAILTIFLGNLIILVPMILVGHAGTKYGIPFAVLLRSSFGVNGAKLPVLFRGMVACFWFGIQVWIGGSAIYVVLNSLSGDWFIGDRLPLLDIDLAQFLCFLAFWLMHIWLITKGTESLRILETYAAPVLILICIALLIWAYRSADGFGTLLAAPSQFVPGGAKEGQFSAVFWAGLTASVGGWSTLALNIPDFTRMARSQKDQIVGQALGLPVPMVLLAFVAVSVTSATVIIFGEAIWDPIQLASRLGGGAVIGALIALILATLTTNMAANVVAPSFGFSALAPSKISLRSGGYITAVIGVIIMPWKLLESSSALIQWLVGIAVLLGPIAGIVLADYYLIRKAQLDIAGLYQSQGPYSYTGGWNIAAVVAFGLALFVNLPGFLASVGIVLPVPDLLIELYQYAWFVGTAITIISYTLLMRLEIFGQYSILKQQR